MANRKDRESIRPSAEPWTDLYQESTLSVVLGTVGTASAAVGGWGSRTIYVPLMKLLSLLFVNSS